MQGLSSTSKHGRMSHTIPHFKGLCLSLCHPSLKKNLSQGHAYKSFICKVILETGGKCTEKYREGRKGNSRFFWQADSLSGSVMLQSLTGVIEDVSDIVYLNDFEVFIYILLTLLPKNCPHVVTNTGWLVSKWLNWVL